MFGHDFLLGILWWTSFMWTLLSGPSDLARILQTEQRSGLPRPQVMTQRQEQVVPGQVKQKAGPDWMHGGTVMK